MAISASGETTIKPQRGEGRNPLRVGMAAAAGAGALGARGVGAPIAGVAGVLPAVVGEVWAPGVSWACPSGVWALQARWRKLSV